MSAEKALATEYEAIDADLEWRRLRGLRFVELVAVDGHVHQLAFKELDTDSKLHEVERRARRLAAEARAAWLTATKCQPNEEVEK